MKKIAMGIAAVAMATAMFAAEPAFSGNVAEYKGEASVTWGVNIDDKATGFKNAESASIKVNIFNGGDKATSGDGIWAELKIKNGGKDVESKDSAEAAMALPKMEIDTAKFHIYDVYVGIRSGNTTLGECKPQTAIKSSNVGVDNVGTNKEKGIVVGYANDYFGIDVDFRSAEGYTNDYGIAAEASLKAVENLELKGGVSYAFNDTNSLAYAAAASYKIAMGDYYLKPAVAYTSKNPTETVAGKDVYHNELVAALLFAWGDEADANAGVYFLDDNDAKKVTPGVSVIYTNDMDTTNAGAIKVAFNLGSKVENLKVAALMEANLDSFADSIAVKGGVAYDIKADDITIAAKAGASYAAGTTDTLNVKVGCDLTGLINNTTFSVLWTSGNLIAEPKAKIGTIDLTAKIAL